MKKELEIEGSLVSLAQLFKISGHTLYIVGGFVRNALMGFCETDIDICSSATPEEVSEMLSNTEYSCVLVNPELGTLHIYNKDNREEYEHTTFRAEEYGEGGNHSPTSVYFVDDIKADASRRDFSANAMYYDILEGEILDFYHGIESVGRRTLETVETPEIVFGRDGLRILRMVRIASELDFDIDADTFRVAKEMVSQLADISQERFNKEMICMLFADNKYRAISNFGMQRCGVELLGELGAWEHVLTAFYSLLSQEQRKKLVSIPWDLLSVAPPVSRVSAFLIDMLEHLGMEPSREVIDLILGVKGIMLNKKEVARQAKIVLGYFKVKSGALSTDKLVRLFLQANNEFNPELFALFKLSGIGENIVKTFDLMQLDRTPMSLRELAINGNDLKEAYPDIPPVKFSTIFSTLLAYSAIMPEMNNQERLLDEAYNVYLRVR